MTKSLAPGEETPVAWQYRKFDVYWKNEAPKWSMWWDCTAEEAKAHATQKNTEVRPLYARPTPAAAAGVPTHDIEEIEAVIACLGDDAAQLTDENTEDERAANMIRAAELLQDVLLPMLAASPVAPVGVPTQQPDSVHSALSTSSVASPAPLPSQCATGRSELPREPL